MANKMLIDATHPEETRVVVVKGQRVEEFDYESASRRPLRGNIYLAKVTRVEPSLQAAFVDYGGNRHGFLAFSEIHPDYYQIPVADRLALIEEEARLEQDREYEEDNRSNRAQSANSDANDDDKASLESQDDQSDSDSDDDDADNGADQEDAVEQLGGDILEEMPDRHRPIRRQYKIQEVIKRRQILLVQVVKEERGNKGAALTTYLSLAGRYSVLMPNTAKGGGISRKITNIEDRKRLKDLAQELEVPEGMGVILRTAGASRTKTEIKRDFEYLMRMWESVRDMTLNSSAPALVYEEGSLIKRTIRDLYNKDIDELLVAGEEGYREAKDFMRMLMPSHAKAVIPYRDQHPLFARHGVEAQLDAMFSTSVTLRSGGYIVINPTEALVSIDVNSGRATREHNIEDTAYKTNLEAAEEIARQLRLRDLAGLIVIDFIDMEEGRNDRAVEKRLKECLKNDRARIQVGRISAFGLMEMSRQRMRTGVLESSSIPCPTCAGSGQVRSIPSVALQVIRALEEMLLRNASFNLTVRARLDVAFYLLNQKRSHLSEVEDRFGVSIGVFGDDLMPALHPFAIQRGEAASRPEPRRPVNVIPFEPEDLDDEIDSELDDSEAVDEITTSGNSSTGETSDEQNQGDGRRKRRRRRRRGGRGGENRDTSREDTSSASDNESFEEDSSDEDDIASQPGPVAEPGLEKSPVEEQKEEALASKEPSENSPHSRRGRRGSGRSDTKKSAEEAALVDVAVAEHIQEEPLEEAALKEEPQAKRPRRGRAKQPEAGAAPSEASASPQPASQPQASQEEAVQSYEPEPVAIVLTPHDPDRPKRAGWWSRAKHALTGT
jgi:ribonuclease E